MLPQAGKGIDTSKELATLTKKPRLLTETRLSANRTRYGEIGLGIYASKNEPDVAATLVKPLTVTRPVSWTMASTLFWNVAEFELSSTM